MSPKNLLTRTTTCSKFDRAHSRLRPAQLDPPYPAARRSAVRNISQLPRSLRQCSRLRARTLIHPRWCMPRRQNMSLRACIPGLISLRRPHRSRCGRATDILRRNLTTLVNPRSTTCKCNYRLRRILLRPLVHHQPKRNGDSSHLPLRHSHLFHSTSLYPTPRHPHHPPPHSMAQLRPHFNPLVRSSRSVRPILPRDHPPSLHPHQLYSSTTPRPSQQA